MRGHVSNRRLLFGGALTSAVLCGLTLLAHGVLLGWVRPAPGIRWELYDSPKPTASPQRSGVSGEVSIDSVLGLIDGRSNGFKAIWKGEWFVSHPGEYDMVLAGRDAVLKIDEQPVIRRNARLGWAPKTRTVALTPGFHHLEVTYSHRAGPIDFQFELRRTGSTNLLMPSAEMFIDRPGRAHWWLVSNAERFRAIGLRLGLVTFMFPVVIVISKHSWGVWRGQTRETQAKALKAGGWALVLVVLLFGWAFRFDALQQKYGPMKEPRWVAGAAGLARPLAAPLRARGLVWPHTDFVDHPYDGGDPAAYLTNARQMHSFYDTEYREPLHIAMIKGFLLLLRSSPLAPSFASMMASILAILATFLLGREAFSYPVGLVAATLLAVEAMVIGWGVDGWRDDLLMLMLTLTSYCLLRFIRKPDFRGALLLGMVSGFSLLTRITSLSYLAPAFCWSAWSARAVPWRRRFELLAASGAIAAAWLLPFLISCALKYGDPLWSINFAPGFYRVRAGQSATQGEGAGHYVLGRFVEDPVKTSATVLEGLTSFPLRNKWFGFSYISPYLPRLLLWSCVAGLAVWLASPKGRALLLVTLASLLPYSLTWNIPGGGEWRFTQPVYPLYLVAACSFYAMIFEALKRATRSRRAPATDP